MKNLLITAAGTGTAFSYTSAIAQNFDCINLYTADTNKEEFVTASLFANKHLTLQSIYTNNFYLQIENIILKENIKYYIPLIDEEIVNAYKYPVLQKAIAANHLIFCQGCTEKSNYSIAFNGIEIRFPKIIKRENIYDDVEYIAKKNYGFGSRGTKIITSKDIATLESDYIIYEKINGTEYTIDCFPTETFTFTSIRKRIEVKNGVCTKALIIRNEQLEASAEAIVRKYQLTHPFCFQVIESSHHFYLIDVNPRLGAGTAMSSINGMDFFSAHLAKLLDKDPIKYLNRFHDSCIVTRQYSNYLMKVL